MELYKTGGGPAQKLLHPTHESVLTLMNTKTVNGLKNRFDSDRSNAASNSMTDSVTDSMTDSITDNTYNNAVYNESNEDKDEYCDYEILDDDSERIEEIHDADVNDNTNALHNKNIEQKTKQMSNWSTYTPNKLKASKHTSLKVTKTNEGKENERNIPTKTTTRQRRSSTMALHSSTISKEYSDLAKMKLELVNLQLIAVKEEMVAKQKQNEMEFELKKKV